MPFESLRVFRTVFAFIARDFLSNRSIFLISSCSISYIYVIYNTSSISIPSDRAHFHSRYPKSFTKFVLHTTANTRLYLYRNHIRILVIRNRLYLILLHRGAFFKNENIGFVVRSNVEDTTWAVGTFRIRLLLLLLFFLSVSSSR